MTVDLPAVLREVTETLGAELAAPSSQAPTWSEMQWTVSRAVAAMHGVSPLLANCLRWRGPRAWSSFLESQWRHTALRQLRIADLLHYIDAQARARGIAVMALKGAALNALGLYAPGERPMADIDLLVRPAKAAELGELLQSMDYELSSANWRESVYVPIGRHEPAPLGEHADNAVKIEVHERIAERLAWHVTDMTSQIFPSDPQPGLNRYDSQAALMKHLLLHAAGSISRQGLRLLQLHDVALLAATMTSADWHEFERESPHSLWWALPPLKMAARYYPSSIPSHAVAQVTRQCPLWLRAASMRATVYEVSLSYPWVDAFPALNWVRTPAELARYVFNRLCPPADLIGARLSMQDTEPWARGAQWAALSQGRRIWRWAVSRPTRPATLHALTAAFTPDLECSAAA